MFNKTIFTSALVILCLVKALYSLPVFNSSIEGLSLEPYNFLPDPASDCIPETETGSENFYYSDHQADAASTQKKKEEKRKEGSDESQSGQKVSDDLTQAEAPFRPHEEILVTATMSPQEVRNCSVSASVVSQEKIAAVSATSALNALLFEPGIFIMRTGYYGRSDIEIRGLGQRGQRIGVMVDGRPEKMGIFGCVVTQTFPLDNVERLEIIRGPHSIFYGSDALGGIVNIITHIPDQGVETQVEASYGSFNTKHLNFKHGAALDKFKYYFTYDRSLSDGHLANSSYSAFSLTGKVRYEFGREWNLTLSGKYYDGIKNEPTILLPNPPPENWFDYKRGAIDLTLSRQAETSDLTFKAYTDFGRHRFSDGWNSRDRVYGGILKYTHSGWKNNHITIGVDYRHLGGLSYNYPVGKWYRSEGGVFLYDQYAFRQKLILTGGLRFNLDSIYGSEVAPSAGIVYILTPDTSLRAVVSKGFRSPQLNELYLFPASNPELKPEILWNYEIGINRNLFQRLNLSLNLFLLSGRDFIETRPNPNPPPMYRMLNVAEYNAKGLEATLSGDINDYLRIYGAATIFDPGNNTIGKARQKYDLILIFKRQSFFSAISAQYVTDYFAGNNSTQRLPSYFLLNYRLEVSSGRYLSIFVDLNNLLNTEYQIYVNLTSAAGPYPMPGRSVNVGLRIKPQFGK